MFRMFLILNCYFVVFFFKLKDQLYLKKRFYIYKCEASVLKGERYRSQLNKLKIVKDMKQLQIAKYLNNIIQLIIHKKLKEAIQMTRLMINFMERIHYSSNRILDLIYRSFGVAQYLMFRFIDGLNEEKNHQRILILLGANEITNCIPLQESIIGPYDSNPKCDLVWCSYKYKTITYYLQMVGNVSNGKYFV